MGRTNVRRLDETPEPPSHKETLLQATFAMTPRKIVPALALLFAFLPVTDAKAQDGGREFPVGTPLATKVFHVEPAVFIQNLRRLGSPAFSSNAPVAPAPAEMDDGPRRVTDGHDASGGPAKSSGPSRLHFVTITNQTEQLNRMFRSHLTSLGVDLAQGGKSVFFNDRTGVLMVRASAADLENVRRALKALAPAAPPKNP